MGSQVAYAAVLSKSAVLLLLIHCLLLLHVLIYTFSKQSFNESLDFCNRL